MSDQNSLCPLCGHPAAISDFQQTIMTIYTCPHCGKFVLSQLHEAALTKVTMDEKRKAIACLRELQIHSGKPVIVSLGSDTNGGVYFSHSKLGGSAQTIPCKK